VDRSTRAASAVYVHCRGIAASDCESVGDSSDPDGHFSQHQHSRCQHRLAIHRHAPDGIRRAHHVGLRALTTTVNDIEHIESQSFNGVGVIKVFFQPSAKIEAALAQVTAIAQTITRQTPAGVTPPLVITYNASSVPILQLGLSGEGLSEQQLNDFAMNNIRTLLATVPGASIPWPYGGKVRQITIDLDLQKLNGLGLSPNDVLNAVNAQNIILPTGTVKLGQTEYNVGLNSSPEVVDELNDLPVKTVSPTRTGGSFPALMPRSISFSRSSR